MHINYIEWFVVPFRANEFLAEWRPALDRALAAGASASYLTRDIDNPLHFRQVSVWKEKADFENYWYSDEISTLRQNALKYYHKPVLPNWHSLAGEAVVETAVD
jgi:quinol monooxygenase YgiN